MTTTNEAREAVYQRFSTQWAETTPITFDGEKFSGDTQTTPWVRVAVFNTGGGQQTLGPIGSRLYRYLAEAYIHIKLPITETAKTADTLAYQAKTIFEGVSFSGLQFNDVQIREIGGDGKFFTYLVTAPFSYWETN